MPARKITIDKCTHCLPYAAIAPRTVTVAVAADDASDEEKDQADYICDGVLDKVEVQAALDAVPATGGTVILLGHQFNLEETEDEDHDVLIISNPHTVLHSPTFATLAADIGWGGYIVKIDADYVKLSNLKVHQTGLEYDYQGDGVGFGTDITNPVLASLEIDTEAGYYPVNAKAGATEAIINNCKCTGTLNSKDATNTNWRVLNCNLEDLTLKGDKCVAISNSISDDFKINGSKCTALNNDIGDSLTIAGHYCLAQGNNGARISLNGNYNYAIGNVLLDSAPYTALYLQGNCNYAIGNYTKTGVDNGYGTGIEVKSGDQCTLIGNTCVDGNYGILINTGANDTRVIGNYCSGHATANLIVGGATAPLHTALIGNYAANGTHYGICLMDSSHYTLLQGNLAYGNVDPGIWLENAQHCVLKGNMVYDNLVTEHGEGGITLYGTVDYCILEGNKCFDTQDPKTQKYGIDIVNANCDENLILGNDVRGNLTAGIHDAGTGTIIRNNLGYNPVGIASISVGESPFTHTAGASPETVYVSGGTVSSITKGGNNFGLTAGAFELEPYESIVVTYTVAPTMFKDLH